MTCVVEGSTDCSSVSRVPALLPVQISADEVERSVGAVDTGSAAAESTVEVVRSVEAVDTGSAAVESTVEVVRSVEAVDTGSAAVESTVEAVRSVEVAQTADVLFWVLSVLLLGQMHPSSCYNRSNWFYD